MELDAIDGDTILASRKSMDRTPPQQPKPRRPRSHRSARLPDDCLKRLFEFAPLSSLLNTLLVSTPWRENALDDPRWDPILPPPALRAPSQWLRPSSRGRSIRGLCRRCRSGGGELCEVVIIASVLMPL